MHAVMQLSHQRINLRSCVTVACVLLPKITHERFWYILQANLEPITPIVPILHRF
jgi:hypothetical protein